MDKKNPEKEHDMKQEEKNQSAQENIDCNEAVTLTKEEFEQVKAHIEELKQQNESTVAVAQRIQADFENFKRRNACVRGDSLDEGARDVIKDLLPVLDNFDRAFASEGPVDEKWADGMKLVYRQLMDTLTKHGLCEIDSSGAFDPELHEAVMQEENEAFESGQVIETLQKGYQVKQRIIRHSMVKVAK